MFRDTRLFILACNDTYAPKQYFEFLRSTRVRVHVVPTTDGTSAPKYVLDRLMEFDCDEGDERWLLLDVDHLAQGTHIGGLIQTIKEARQKGVHLALSKPSFEVWLLLHHEEAVAVGDLGERRKWRPLFARSLELTTKPTFERSIFRRMRSSLPARGLDVWILRPWVKILPTPTPLASTSYSTRSTAAESALALCRS